jgi:hypothetical protein
MLEVQKYLTGGKSLEDLSDEFSIKITNHKNLPLVILNYDQIESKPRNHAIVRECRNLILENFPPYKLVSRSFYRFWNLSEFPLEFESFNLNDFFFQEKIDGSLMTLFNYKGQWLATTRSTFADGVCGESGKTWAELFHSVLSLEKINSVCDSSLSYVFEFCSPWNKIITEYKTPKLYLLSIFDGKYEFHPHQVDYEAQFLNLERPKYYNFKNVDEILSYVGEQTNKNPTWDGVVINDLRQRWKIKNPGYLSLHRLANNGEGFKVKTLLPFILKGEEDEALVYIKRYFAEVIPLFEETKQKVNEEKKRVEDLWNEVKEIESQKEFALAVVPRTKLSAILFQCRKQKKNPHELWGDFEELIYKALF